jgi:hypothetical protein
MARGVIKGGRVKAKLGGLAKGAASKARARVQDTRGPSPNPATNLMLADIVIRGGGRLLRHTVEKTLLGAKYPPGKADDIVKSRTMLHTLVGTAVARVATRSVPGALIVGGGLLAKTLYDRSKRPIEAEAEGEAQIADLTQNARKA